MMQTVIQKGTGSFDRGVHPPEGKAFSEAQSIEVLPAPEQVAIPVLQHTGAPCEPVVAAKQDVLLGDLLGDSKAFISAPIHAPISGTIQKDGVCTLPNGRHIRTVVIKGGSGQMSGEDVWDNTFGGDWPREGIGDRDPAQIVAAVRAAGIVGQGGAAFPTHVKLTRNDKKPVDVILLNGCECEPYLTADYRLMLEAPDPIVIGAMLAARAAGASRVVIAIEDHKENAIEAMRRAAAGTSVDVVGLETKYPMGGEKQTVRAALGRTIPTGGLPLDVGVVVINIATAAAIARAVLRGKPLTHRVVCVTGPGIASPKNVLAPVGVTYQALIDFCGGLKPDAARVVAGGPMMGFAMGAFNTPVTKGTSGIVVLTDEEVRRAAETNCVRCGRCVDVCPLNLVPTKIALAARHKDWDLARRHHMLACMECGCCAYICPAGIPLVQLIRMGKAQMLKEKAG